MIEKKEKIKRKTKSAKNPIIEILPLLPLKNVVILPKSIIPIVVGRTASIDAVESALKIDKTIFITSQKNENTESPTIDDVFTIGTKSIILQVMRMPNGALKILAEGLERAQVIHSDDKEGFLTVTCQELPTTGTQNSIELEALWRHLKSAYTTYISLNEKAPADITKNVITPQEIDFAVDTMTVHINLSLTERQTILEIIDLKERMLKLCAFLQKEIDILKTEQRIKGQVQTQVEKGQREYYLGEQIKAIQKELGKEDHSAEINSIREKLDKLGLLKEAYEKAEKELKRLENMSPLSSEATVSRHYVDWIISLPWQNASKDNISLVQAENLLNQHHAGLQKAKERIIEFLAAKKFSKNKGKSPIICLVGPPGVGKTSLAKSIAQSLGREFIRISLGGIKDEAEIRGHRRTYIGALPGKIIQAMKRAGTVNPVILLDEIDKMSQDFHGDPASALLEVLDPEQNSTFVDHFLDLEYDLSQVMFIATANMHDGIPYALYDRMDMINLSGYTEEEKLEIARTFLIPKKLTEHSLTKTQFKLSTDLLSQIISKYTKEAGVRQLERILAKLMRKSIQILLKDSTVKSVTITEEKIAQWLGHPKYKRTSLNGKPQQIGLATGLAWTEVGGDVLEIETSIVPGKGGMQLTGQLGDVMQESAHAALSYIRAKAASMGIKPSFYTTTDIHIHMPEGATPKDGPSAGITICTALVSALTETPVRDNLAMTGEITLQGRVLSVGGLKEKLLAAKQHNCTTVIVPQENENDIKDILKEIDLGDLKLVFASTMDQVLKTAFEIDIFKRKLTEKKKASKKKSKSAKKPKPIKSEK